MSVGIFPKSEKIKRMARTKKHVDAKESAINLIHSLTHLETQAYRLLRLAEGRNLTKRASGFDSRLLSEKPQQIASRTLVPDFAIATLAEAADHIRRAINIYSSLRRAADTFAYSGKPHQWGREPR